MIHTPDGYAFRLKYDDGLMWIPLRLPTEHEIEKLVHVDMSSQMYWNPSDEKEQHDDWSPISEHPETQELNDFFGEHEGVFIGDSINCNASHTQHSVVDYETLRPYLGWKPVDVVKNTLKVTTRLAKINERLPQRRHFKSRFPALNVRRLDEIFATDTLFASCKAHDGSKCAQLFVGKSSYLTQCWGMKTDGEFPATLMDFIRTFGAMKGLMSYNAKSVVSKTVNDILRQYCIIDMTSEPMTQWQNPAERRIKEVKNLTRSLMDRTGTPAYLWLLALKYACYILNRIAHKTLDGKTPMEIAGGVTPDISSLLVFVWYEPVLYHVHEMSFPKSKEKSGYFVGIAENVGDALTFLIMTNDTGNIISRSVVRSKCKESPNLRVEHDPNLDDDVGSFEFVGDTDNPVELMTTDTNTLPTVDPISVIEDTFLVGPKIDLQKNENCYESCEDDDDDITKHLKTYSEDVKDDLVTYSNTLDSLKGHLQETRCDDWMPKKVIDHKRLNGKWKVLMKW